MKNLIIGVDADVTLNGVAILNTTTNEIEVKNLSFFDLFDYLKAKAMANQIKTVRLEFGSLNKSNWHLRNNQKINYAGQIGQRVGRNHETSQKIKEMLEYLGIKHELVKPTKSKLDNATLQQKLERLKITGLPKRTNAEVRDAVSLLV
jgi:coenzyme F420-reducing hydrogenase beta subunit